MRRLDRKYQRWYFRRLALKMGLAHCARPPRWTEIEEKYLLDHYPAMGLKALRRALMALNGGTPRSFTAICLKIKRLHLLSTDGEGFTIRGICDLFGCDHHRVERWIAAGWLRGKRRGTLRTKRQGGDQWHFDPARVRSFIVAHPEEIDVRRVEPVAFIRLVAGDAPLSMFCRCPCCGAEYEEETIFDAGNAVNWRYCPTCRLRMQDVGDGDERRYAVVGR